MTPGVVLLGKLATHEFAQGGPSFERQGAVRSARKVALSVAGVRGLVLRRDQMIHLLQGKPKHSVASNQVGVNHVFASRH